MYKPDEKNIDRLSREAAEHYHAPGEPSWDALQQILDKELPQEKEKKRRGFFFFFLLLLGLSLTGSVIWYGVTINKKDKAIIVSDKTNAESIPGKSAVTQSSATKNTNAEIDKTNASSTINPNSVSAKSSTAATGSKESIQPTKEVAGNTLPVHDANNNIAAKTGGAIPVSNAKNNNAEKSTALNTKEPIAKKQKNTNAGSYGKTGSNNTIAGAGIVTAKGHGNKTKANKTVSGNTNLTEATDKAGNDIADDNAKNDVATNTKKDDHPVTTFADTAITKTTVAKPVVPDQPVTKSEKKDSATAAKKKTKSKNEKAFNIGLTAGLDLSTVKYTHSDNVGFNFGLMGGYQFSKHWSVYTGIIYTKKNYEANGSDYHPPKHYWTQYVDLQTVEGYCRMWEVPLLARYTFNPGSKTAFFVSTGISSYFMKEQHYNYSYKTMSGMPATAEWDNDSTFNHVFSILHLSAGFEKRLGKHMNWQIEPYAKIPLGGVGFGNIKLSSFGINFSIQYRQPVKR